MKIGLQTGCGHVASAMSCVNVLCDVYEKWPEGIVILSKGHGALAQYVILNELGKLPNKVLKTYAQDGGLSEHSTLMPEYGIYASTGSLGHGLAIGIGYALAEKERPVIVILGDGELDEGSTLEALRVIKRLKVGNILPLVDANNKQGFQDADLDLSFQIRPYYATKGEDWGPDIENNVRSHYTVVTENVYKSWKMHAKAREKRRLEAVKMAQKAKEAELKSKEQHNESGKS